MLTQMQIEFVGDRTLLLNFGDRIDAALNTQVHAVAHCLREARLAGLSDITPAYTSIAIQYDPVAWQGSGPEQTPGERLAMQLSTIVDKYTCPQATLSLPCFDVPVCYGGEHGPDLLAVAAHAQLDPGEVIAHHTAGEYHVAMLGFAPGFPYLLGLDDRLNMPRRANPRTHVPAGSVAIGGAQTGIYPRDLPGGWQIIGRTPIDLFNPTKHPPALLAPGQTLRFHAIEATEFASLTSAPTQSRQAR